MADYLERGCRACGGPLDPILDLGKLRVSSFPKPDDPPPPAVPLVLGKCAMCGLTQLQHTTNPDLLYRHQYWYRSGVNELMKVELADVVARAQAKVKLTPDDIVVDIGANDGTLLACYQEWPKRERPRRVAFEPARNLHLSLQPNCELLIPDFFPGTVADLTSNSLQGRAKIITSIAMVYDVDDLGLFLEGIRAILHPQGVWVVQFQDLAQMLRATAFDNICHEHLTYFTLESFSRVLEPYGLVVGDVEVRRINGGSLRCYVRHRGYHREHEEEGGSKVFDQMVAEHGCDDWEHLERFAWKVGQTRQQLTAAIGALHDPPRSGPIDLYAASTKANTLLQVCGLDGSVIRQAWERSPEKWGRVTVTDIPIVSEEVGRTRAPAVLLLGAWQFKESFIAREAEYLLSGGMMFVPLPGMEIVTAKRRSAWRGMHGRT